MYGNWACSTLDAINYIFKKTQLFVINVVNLFFSTPLNTINVVNLIYLPTVLKPTKNKSSIIFCKYCQKTKNNILMVFGHLELARKRKSCHLKDYHNSVIMPIIKTSFYVYLSIWPPTSTLGDIQPNGHMRSSNINSIINHVIKWVAK